MENDLYNKTIAELNQMARDKGINFPPNYNGPYSLKFLGNLAFDNAYKLIPRYGHKEMWTEYNENGKDSFDMYSVEAGNMGSWYCIYGKERAEKDVEYLNKRHFIVAMQSSDPKSPVLI